MEKLEKEFIKSGGTWKEYRIGDIFEIETPKKKFNANTLKFDGAYPYIARGEQNNGIRGYIDQDIIYLNDGNTISFGQDTATIFYQSHPYFTGDKIKTFIPKLNKFNKAIALYIISVLKIAFTNFSWGSSSYNVDVLNEIIIPLPTQNGEPAFSFMEHYIEELEAERIEELEAYLKATGLKNYELSQNDVKSLDEFNEIAYIVPPPPPRKIILRNVA